MNRNLTNTFFIILISFLPLTALAQTKVYKGIIRDKQSDEPIPFAAALLKYAQEGALSDSSGKFTIISNKVYSNDTLIISNVGYKDAFVPVSFIKDSGAIIFKLEVKPPAYETVVKVKYNRALWFWKKIMQHKPNNDKTKWDNYAYEIYNKLEVDLDNVNKSKLSQNKLLKPLNFVLEFVDSTSEEKPFLPVYITETLSDYFYQKKSEKN